MPIGPFFYTPYDLLIIPAFLFAIWAQIKVSSAYNRWSQVFAQAGITGADIARYIMDKEGIHDVRLERVPGELTDHYDPTQKVVRLSEGVFDGTSVAALGIAAHEVGHVIQHARGYAAMQLRSFVYPVANLGSWLAFPLFFAGLIFSMPALVSAGIWLFAGAVAFTLITLPVEFDASRRALKALAGGGFLSSDEMRGARQVLTAAALTYVAAAAMAIVQFLRLVAIARSRD